MRKFSFGTLPLLLGIGGFFLRRLELLYAFDERNLPIPHSPISYALAALLFAAAVLFLWTGRWLPAVREKTANYAGSFRSGPYGLAVQLAAGLTLLVAAVLQIFSMKAAESMGVFEMAFAALCLLSGLSVCILAYGTVRGGSSNGACGASLAIVIFLCCWLVYAYKGRAADPVLLDYMYEFLAICSTTLAFYYYAGYAFSKAHFRRAVFFSQLGVFLCITTLADAREIGIRLMFIAFAALMTVSGSLLVKNKETAARES